MPSVVLTDSRDHDHSHVKLLRTHGAVALLTAGVPAGCRWRPTDRVARDRSRPLRIAGDRGNARRLLHWTSAIIGGCGDRSPDRSARVRSAAPYYRARSTWPRSRRWPQRRTLRCRRRPSRRWARSSGLTVAPAGVITRAQWPSLVPVDAVGRAMLLESAADEAVFLVGPVLVTSLGQALGAEAALVAVGCSPHWAVPAWPGGWPARPGRGRLSREALKGADPADCRFPAAGLGICRHSGRSVRYRRQHRPARRRGLDVDGVLTDQPALDSSGGALGRAGRSTAAGHRIRRAGRRPDRAVDRCSFGHRFRRAVIGGRGGLRADSRGWIPPGRRLGSARDAGLGRRSAEYRSGHRRRGLRPAGRGSRCLRGASDRRRRCTARGSSGQPADGLGTIVGAQRHAGSRSAGGGCATRASIAGLRHRVHRRLVGCPSTARCWNGSTRPGWFVVVGFQAIPVGVVTGCSSGSTGGNNANTTDAKLIAQAAREEVAIIVAPGSRAPWFASNWTNLRMRGMKRYHHYHVYLSPKPRR